MQTPVVSLDLDDVSRITLKFCIGVDGGGIGNAIIPTVVSSPNRISSSGVIGWSCFMDETGSVQLRIVDAIAAAANELR